MASAGAAPAPIPTSNPVPAHLAAAARVRSGASWFYWIAGLSLINSVVVIFGGNFHFVIGLGITTVVDALAKSAGNAGTILDLVINGLIAGVFCVFAHFACKAQKWPFLVGMALYTLDALLLLMVKDILSVGFHAYALYAIYRGFAAIRQTHNAQAVQSVSGAAIVPR